MVLFALASFVLVASSSGSDLVLLFSALGGLSGLAALASVLVNWRYNTKKAKQEDKSIAFTELEKAVPGLGSIIETHQTAHERLNKELSDTRAELDREREENAKIRQEIEDLHLELADCRVKLVELNNRYGLSGDV